MKAYARDPFFCFSDSFCWGNKCGCSVHLHANKDVCMEMEVIFRCSPEYQQLQYSLRQMQNRFAGELSLPQALRDLTNVVPGSLHLDWRPQLLLGYQLREPGQSLQSRTTL